MGFFSLIGTLVAKGGWPGVAVLLALLLLLVVLLYLLKKAEPMKNFCFSLEITSDSSRRRPPGLDSWDRLGGEWEWDDSEDEEEESG